MGNKSPFPTVTKRLNTKKLARYGVVLCALSCMCWMGYAVLKLKVNGPNATIDEYGAYWIGGTGLVFLVCGIILEGKNLIEGIKNYLK